jgi:hypothetical protein
VVDVLLIGVIMFEQPEAPGKCTYTLIGREVISGDTVTATASDVGMTDPQIDVLESVADTAGWTLV